MNFDTPISVQEVIVTVLTLGVAFGIVMLAYQTFRRVPRWNTIQEFGRWIAGQDVSSTRQLPIGKCNHIAKMIVEQYEMEADFPKLLQFILYQLRAENYDMTQISSIREILSWEIRENESQFNFDLEYLSNN